MLRNGIKHGAHQVELFHATPTPGNTRAEELFALNCFTITRQLRYSRDETQLALDLALFINGLPVATFELKNSLTKQTVEDSVEQYKRDRDPREPLFQFGRCVVHFAVDDGEVRFCTHLQGKASWFLPFNQGWNDGTGNPPNPAGLKTDCTRRFTPSAAALTTATPASSTRITPPLPPLVARALTLQSGRLAKPDGGSRHSYVTGPGRQTRLSRWTSPGVVEV